MSSALERHPEIDTKLASAAPPQVMARPLSSLTATLSIIVPVFNEQYLVEASLERLRVLGNSDSLHRIRVIVVDDASTDRSALSIQRFREIVAPELSQKIEWIYLRHEKNRGKGAAIRTALKYVDTDLVGIHDADLEYHPADMLKMIPLFLEEGADAVYGSRFLSAEFRRVLFFRHALGNHFLTFLCNLACDLNLTDMETCYKMIRTDVLKDIPLESSGFGIEPELTIKLAKRSARIFEVPIRYAGRTYQEGKKIKWMDGLRALWVIFKLAISDRVYQTDQHGGEILSRLERAPKLNKWMAETIRPYVGERVLELGAGIGNLTLNLAPKTLYWASDINPHYLQRLRKMSETRPYLSAAYIDATERQSFPRGQLFDTVVCLNVLEHLQDDVSSLRNIRDSLDEDGRAIILVPQGPKLFGTLDEVLGHYRRYTKKQLIAAGEQAGLVVEALLSFNRFGVTGWWLNGKIMRRRTFGFWQIKLLNFIVPVIRHLDRWLPLPALSLIAIFRKDSSGFLNSNKRSETVNSGDSCQITWPQQKSTAHLLSKPSDARLSPAPRLE